MTPGSLFGVGGEVATEMARCDWKTTSVGPPETWPALLRTQVRILLTSRFSMWMGWGPELAFFYNDAYRRDTLGVKHPWALGRPAREVWAEIWGDIGPRIERVLSTGVATWDEALLLFLERSGFKEETYHTFSYSPLSDFDGSVAGMLCVVSEETDRVIGERRMTTLRELAADLATTRTDAGVLSSVETHAVRNDCDLPFTLVYLFDGSGTAKLAAASGIAPGHPAAPRAIAAGDDAAWPLTAVRRTQEATTVPGLGDRFDDLPTGGWDTPPELASIVPLSQQGQPEPAGVLVVGLNPYRPFDAAYNGFVDLLAGQVASGIAGARAYQAERERAEALAELDRAKTQFFSNVSHEFRTPLTLIAGPVEDALNDLDAPVEVRRERLEVIRRNADRLRRLVNDLLDFARIEAGRLRAEHVAVDLAEFTRDVAASFSPAIERAGLEFTIDCPPLDRPVHIDRDMWEKIVLNLLSNALKFTLDGGISIGLRPQGDSVELTVTDTGVGIAADHVPLLFQRFHRAPATAARSHEGTGIGLALVAELIRLHDGGIEVTSKPRRGTTFTVRIPYGAPSTMTEAPTPRDNSRRVYLDEALQWSNRDGDPAPSPVSQEAAGDTGGATVLVIDDNPDLRAYIARLLAPHWNVAVASDGVEGLERARRERPDLILSDVMMPGLDGFGLLLEVRADPQLSTIPVIFLSARAGEEAAIEGLDAGADDYLVKPFSALELLARVRVNLELARFRARLLEESQTVATALQRAILGPSTVPAQVAVRYAPAVRPLEVGGDWYDALVLPDGRIGLVVGDCVGRGLPAAAVMGQIRSACRALLLQLQSPAAVVQALDAFAEHLPGAACTTLLCATVDVARGTVVYSSAGHVPPIVVGADGTVTVLDGGGSIPLGIAADRSRPEASAELPAGSSLLLYTDGLVERRRENLDLGIARLAETACTARHLDEEDLATHVMRSVLPAEGQADDVALVIYRQPADRAEFSLDVHSDASELAGARRRLREWLTGQGVDDQTITDVLVAIGEAASNAIEHAYAFSGAGTVRISADRRGAGLNLTIEDSGRWKPEGHPGERGRGLRIMRALMDDVRVERTERGTRIRLTKRLHHDE